MDFGCTGNLTFYLDYAQYEKYLPVTFFSNFYRMILINYLFAGRCSYRAEIVQEISRIEIARQADRGSQRPLR